MFGIRCVIKRNHAIVNLFRRPVSALYITSDKLKDNCPVVTPYMDFEYFVEHAEDMERNVKDRRLDIDVKSVLKKYERFRNIRDKVRELEIQRQNVTNELKNLNSAEQSKQKFDDLKEKGKFLRQTYKALKEEAYPIQDDFVIDFLDLPNELHELCPKEESVLLFRHGLVPEKTDKSIFHLDRTDLVKFSNNTIYYLMEEAAHFDIECTHECSRYFAAKNFVLSKNPDFTRRVLMDASTTSIKDYHMVIEKETENKINTTFLTGGGSFQSFLGFITRLSIYPSILSLRLVTFGRRYKIIHDPTKRGLYAATQTNSVCLFSAAESAEAANKQMDEILNLIVDFYKSLGIYFQIRYISAPELSPAESLKAVIEVYSPVCSSYIEVGSLSNYSDFISKRILFNVRHDKEYSFPYIVGGPILLTTPLIAALIENNIPLDSIKLPDPSAELSQCNAIDEFKSLFKCKD